MWHALTLRLRPLSLLLQPVGVPPSEYSPEIDGLKMNSATFTSARLSNSELC